MKRSRPKTVRLRGPALRTELARRQKVKDDEKRRRRRRWLLVLLLLLLLLLKNCCCRPPPPEPGPPQAGVPEATLPAPPPVAPAPAPARQARRTRPPFEVPDPSELPWLAPFRLQVAARSPRLAECFLGAPHPGTLKWTAAVQPGAGRISDQKLEPTLTSDELTVTQRVCLLGVLSEPPYRLDAAEAGATPSRIGMVIEF